VTVTLTEDGGATRVCYDADAVIGGVIGGVGQRMLIGVAKKLAGEFFGGVEDVLTGSRTAAPVPGESVPSQPVPGESAVFTAAAVGRSRPAPDSFFAGAVFGAATALIGVLVGARTARPNRTYR